ncbi:hypothetical protein DAEQUDRAFT_738807 [Daedalea quercina L-15889]|uniref:Uncharacterized protein n=1 Tax=Daedalea quercina L-15889 TaxID=1314783 RepID=A0A165PHV1_9APHY|nr:hypothetical protein DAEQUDRAFT_738807 [Daedalea quercina L-15889]
MTPSGRRDPHGLYVTKGPRALICTSITSPLHSFGDVDQLLLVLRAVTVASDQCCEILYRSIDDHPTVLTNILLRRGSDIPGSSESRAPDVAQTPQSSGFRGEAAAFPSVSSVAWFRFSIRHAFRKTPEQVLQLRRMLLSELSADSIPEPDMLTLTEIPTSRSLARGARHSTTVEIRRQRIRFYDFDFDFPRKFQRLGMS